GGTRPDPGPVRDPAPSLYATAHLQPPHPRTTRGLPGRSRPPAIPAQPSAGMPLRASLSESHGPVPRRRAGTPGGPAGALGRLSPLLTGLYTHRIITTFTPRGKCSE